MSVAQRLEELGLTLPAVVPPVASYVPAVSSGGLVYTSGQLPMVDGKMPRIGKVGGEVAPEDAKADARQCALNAAEGFEGQPGVVNGASDLLGEIFGDAGKHARSAVGVAELPLGAPVEVELIVAYA